MDDAKRSDRCESPVVDRRKTQLSSTMLDEATFINTAFSQDNADLFKEVVGVASYCCFDRTETRDICRMFVTAANRRRCQRFARIIEFIKRSYKTVHDLILHMSDDKKTYCYFHEPALRTMRTETAVKLHQLLTKTMLSDIEAKDMVELQHRLLQLCIDCWRPLLDIPVLCELAIQQIDFAHNYQRWQDDKETERVVKVFAGSCRFLARSTLGTIDNAAAKASVSTLADEFDSICSTADQRVDVDFLCKHVRTHLGPIGDHLRTHSGSEDDSGEDDTASDEDMLPSIPLEPIEKLSATVDNISDARQRRSAALSQPTSLPGKKVAPALTASKSSPSPTTRRHRGRRRGRGGQKATEHFPYAKVDSAMQRKQAEQRQKQQRKQQQQKQQQKQKKRNPSPEKAAALQSAKRAASPQEKQVDQSTSSESKSKRRDATLSSVWVNQ